MNQDDIRKLQPAAMLAKTLGDANRLRILFAIAKEKQAVSRIVEQLGISQPLVSHHLKELRRLQLVNVERSGPFVFYKMADPRILSLIETINCLAADLLKQRTGF